MRITVHYHRLDECYSGWSLWTWPSDDCAAARELQPVAKDEFGLVFRLEVADHHAAGAVGLLPKRGDWRDKDGPHKFWRALLGNEVYLLQGDPEVYTRRPLCEPGVKDACLDSRDCLRVNMNIPVSTVELTRGSFVIAQDGNRVEVRWVDPYDEADGWARTFVITTDASLDLEAVRTGGLTVQFEDSALVTIALRYVLDDPAFYCDEPLGPRVTPDETSFRVWAPCAREVRVVLGPELPLPRGVLDEPKTAASFPMTYVGKGAWELLLQGDFRNWYYRLDTILTSDPETLVSVYDPYARAIDRKHGAGILIDDNTPIADGPAFEFSDASIYEVHVRDFSIDPSSGALHPGTYLGLSEKGTRLPGEPGVKTGFDHLCELGVNTIQLMPVHAFEIDENSTRHSWGYMTLHFNAPEAVYATDCNGRTAVAELKRAIDQFHRSGFKVTLDVVYNHTTETRVSPAHFNGLAPDYFYRTRPDGTYWNGSGCGNEFRTEGAMARKFILDSLAYWVREYNVDGFRFDLMGLIDRDTMVDVVRTLRQIKPHVFIYGEPWAGGDTPLRVTGKGDQKAQGFSCFNDLYRIAVVGGVFDDSPGYMFDGRNLRDVRKGWRGSGEWFTQCPAESLNYMECHDNRTLRDKIDLTAHAHFPHMTDAERHAVDRLGAFLIILAQGVPFLHLGQDFFRTKFDEHNSYNAGDNVNRIRWRWKAENKNLFDYYRGLLAIRSAHPVCRLRTRKEIEKKITFADVKAPYFVCEIDGRRTGDSWRRALAIVNPTKDQWTCKLPTSARGWEVYVVEDHASAKPLRSLPVRESVVEVLPRSAMLLAERKT